MKYLLTCALMLAAGCLSVTESQRMNAAAITDLGVALAGDADADHKAAAEQLVMSAKTNEAVLGSPKKRLPVSDLAGIDANRIQAEKDIESGGFWAIFTADFFYGLSGIAGLLGLGFLSPKLTTLAKQSRSWFRRAEKTENTGRRIAKQIDSIAKSVKKRAGST